MTADGAALREPVSSSDLEMRREGLVIPASGLTIGDDEVRSLRDADRGSRLDVLVDTSVAVALVLEDHALFRHA